MDGSATGPDMIDAENPNPDPENAPREPFIPWDDLNDVPEGRRELLGVRLSLEQANLLSEWAHDGMTYSTHDPAVSRKEHGPTVVLDWGNAKERFQDAYEVRDGLWVLKVDEDIRKGDDA